MAEKNRFSRLLKYLLSVSEVKNYTLAQELQYDVSYISKWTSGQMIPSEKSEDKILRGISKCIVEGCGDEGLNKLMKEYQVDNRADLEHAILDNLEEEYSYVKDLQRSSGVDVAPQLFFFPETIQISAAYAFKRVRHLYRTLLYTILGYLSGSLLFAKFFSRLLDGEDVTAESPDKNPGVYNAFLYGGKFCGILTLCCDLLKGFFPVYLYSRAPDLSLFPAGNGPAIPVVSGGGLALVLAAPVLGHIFPLWHRFRGGKGITVTFGVLLGLLPKAGPVEHGIWEKANSGIRTRSRLITNQVRFL